MIKIYIGFQEPGPDALALETPLAKKIRVDDYIETIEITDSSPSWVDFDSCDIAQDEADKPESYCISDSENVVANCATPQDDIMLSTEAYPPP